MQLSDIRSRVRERLDIDANDNSITDAVLTELINAAIRKVNLLQDWPWLVTVDTTLTATVAGTRVYTPASDWRKTQYIMVDSDQQLRPMQPQAIERHADADGFPRFYAVRGGSLILAPEPDAVYSITHVYIKNETALSANGDEPAAPDWAIDMYIEYAAVLVARRLRDQGLTRLVEEEFGATYRSMLDEVRRTRQHPTPQHRLDVGWP